VTNDSFRYRRCGKRCACRATALCPDRRRVRECVTNFGMELLERLFMGSPALWGGGVAHSVLILALVVALGIMLGKIRVAGVSLGVTGILFVGIAFGWYGMNVDGHLLHFLKEFGLILFVYSIGLQVGPGFFS